MKTNGFLRKSVAIGFIFISALSTGTLGLAATELARVNGTVISLEDFNQKYQEAAKFFQFKAPSKKAVLDDLIKRELGIQEAKKLGVDKEPEVLDRMHTVLYHALLDKRLSKELENTKISDADAKNYYSRNPEVRTSHIFVAVAPNAKPEEDRAALTKIKKIQAESLKPGKMTFAEVAQKFSEGVAAPLGGDIDYQTKDKLDPAYYAAAIALRTPGKVSDIVKTQFGYHIIKLTQIRPWEEADKNQVKRMVYDERRTAAFEKYMDELRSKAKISTNANLIKE